MAVDRSKTSQHGKARSPIVLCFDRRTSAPLMQNVTYYTRTGADYTLEPIGEIGYYVALMYHNTIQAAVNNDSKTELEMLRDSKPVELTEKRRHRPIIMLLSSGRVDESRSVFANRMESLKLSHKKTGHLRTNVVNLGKSHQCQSCDQ